MTNRLSETDLTGFDTGGDGRDELFDVLSHPHRRFILHALQTTNVAVPVDELTTELVAWEARRPVADRSGDGRDGIRISLLHSHLPKMARAGLIRYDETQQTVTLADRTDEVRAHLHPMADD